VTVQWILLVPGLVFIGAGLVVLGFRTWVFKFIMDSERAMYGKLADPLVRRAKPWNVTAFAIGWICFGALLILLSVLLPPYHGR
jgi:hypothetical protein